MLKQDCVGALLGFEQDLDAYPAWLAQRKASGQSRSAPAAGNSQHNRRMLKTHTARLNRIEREIASLSAIRERLEQQLSDNSIYDEKNRETLNSTLAAQAENQQRLNLAEEDWLQLSETIEAMAQQSG